MGYHEEQWWVSPSNYAEEVTSRFRFAPEIEILDTTLRDGEQQPKVVFSRKEKVKIAKKLDAIGVHRIEAGNAVVSTEDADAIREICSCGLNAKIYSFTRNVVKDIELAKDCGVDGVLCEVPGSEHMLDKGMKWTVEKAINAARETTAAAHELGLKVTFFPADGSRASLPFLLDTLEAITDGGHLDAVALVDTFGTFSPEGAAYTVRKLRERLKKPVEAHFHEDFGLSVATTIAALQAGASVAHATVNGIGERTGNTPIEPLVVALKCLYGIDTGIDTTKMIELSREVAALCNMEIPSTKAIVGEQIFGWETGMPVGMWKNCKDENPLVMLPYLWSMTGQREPYIYVGKKSGAANILLVAEELGIDLPQECIKPLNAKIKALSIEKKRDITRDEFAELAEDVMKKGEGDV